MVDIVERATIQPIIAASTSITRWLSLTHAGRAASTLPADILSASLFHLFASSQTPNMLLQFSFSQLHHVHAQTPPDNQQAALKTEDKKKRPHITPALQFPC